MANIPIYEQFHTYVNDTVIPAWRVSTKKRSIQTAWSNDREYACNRRDILIELIVSIQKRYDMSSFGE